jgi:hypothetical protein
MKRNENEVKKKSSAVWSDPIQPMRDPAHQHKYDPHSEQAWIHQQGRAALRPSNFLFQYQHWFTLALNRAT